MTKKNTTTAALAVILAMSLAGTAMANTSAPTSTDHARRAAEQRSASLVQRTSQAPSVAPLTSLDEVRAAVGRAQLRSSAPVSSASRGRAVVTSLDEARAAIAAPSSVKPAPAAPAPVEQARAQRASRR
jgi:hypothetical protein